MPYHCIWERVSIVRTVEQALWYCLQGKSALWSHLSNYQELKECNDTSKPIDPNLLTPGEYTDSIACVWVMLLMLWWFIHLFQIVLPLQLCCGCLVVQGHLCSVALLMFGGSGSLVFSCTTSSVVLLMFGGSGSLVFSCTASSVALLMLGGSGSLVFGYTTSSVALLMFGGSGSLVLSCTTSSVVWLELLLFS